MNRCLCCNEILTEQELTILYDWGEPVELCLDCLGETTLHIEDFSNEY